MISWGNPWNASTSLFWRVRTLPLYVIWTLSGFTAGWVQTRRLRQLFLGIPALASALLVIALTIQSRADLDTGTIRRYIDTAQLSLRKNQIERAEFYVNRLKSWKHQNDPFLQVRADIAIARERPDLAVNCFRDMLVNTDHSQDAQAHQQLALAVLKTTKDPNSDAASEAIQHLQLALEAHPGDLTSHELLAKLFMTRGDLVSAALHLEPVAQANPGLQIDLARVYEQLGRQSKQVEAAKQAELYFAASIADHKSHPPRADITTATRDAQQVTDYLVWSEALIMQGKFEDAANIITNALDQQNAPALRQRLASIYLQQANTLPAIDESWRQRFELVTLSRNYDPDAREALVILANIAAHAPFDLRPLALKEIQPYLENGKAPPAAYYLIGTAAAQDKLWDDALKLLRRSIELEPQADIAWNNLAYTLHSMPNPDWKEAERCVIEAIRLNPTPAIYHETRGHIMVGQERWAEAVQELERALREFPSQPQIHGGLSLAYSRLGDDDLADYHRLRQAALSR